MTEKKRFFINLLIDNDLDVLKATSYEAHSFYKDKFNVDCSFKSFRRSAYKALKFIKNNNIVKRVKSQEVSSKSSNNIELDSASVRIEGNEMTINSYTKFDGRITTIEELISYCNIDLDYWEIESSVINKWEVGRKDSQKKLSFANGVINGEVSDSGGFNVEPLFKVEVKLRKKKLEPSTFLPVSPILLQNKILPESHKEDYKSNFDSIFKKVFIIADAQMSFFRENWHSDLEPTHSRKVMSLFLAAVEKYKPETILLNGDMLDLTDWSTHFAVSPDFVKSTQPALIELAVFIALLREICPTSDIVYLYGNHEKRMIKNLMSNFTAAYGLKKVDLDKDTYVLDDDVVSLKYLLNLDRYNVKIIEDYPEGSYWITEDLEVNHGTKGSGKSGLTAANTIRDSIYSQIVGHTHKSEHATKTLKKGNIIEVHSLGCACRIDGAVPAYQKRMNWQQGFGIVSVNKTTQEFKVDHINLLRDDSIVINDQHISLQDAEYYHDYLKDCLHINRGKNGKS